jgi:PAS domain S-box-containing protein
MRNKPMATSQRRRAHVTPQSGARRSTGQRLRTLVDYIHLGVVIVGPRTEIQFANQAALDTFGMTKAQVLGKTSEELGLITIREDGSEYPFAMRPAPRVIESGQPVRNEVVGFRHRGSEKTIWIYGAGVPQFTKEGSLKHVIFTFTDITDWKNAEAALHRASELNRQILASAQEGIIVYDRQLRYTHWNRFLEKYTGIKEKDVLGKHPLELFPFLGELGVFAKIERALAGEITYARDIPFSFPVTNEIRWFNAVYAPLRDEQGEIAGVVATVNAVTKQKQVEEKLHKLSSRLLQLQDEERRRIARDLHDSFSQSVLAVSLNLARVSDSEKALQERSQHALSEAQKLVKDLARNIRALSYLLHPPELDELGLTSAIEEYAKGFSERTGIQLDLDLSSGAGRFSQEAETALFRVLQESLGNIQKHSGSSTGKIRLAANPRNIELVISDAGVGIPSGILNEERTTTGALGIGILGMRERMRQLGGHLEIRSGSGGTTVTAILPLTNEVSNAGSHSDRR